MALTDEQKTITVAIGLATDVDNIPGPVAATLEILLPAADQLIETYAPDAPQAVKRAALVRLGGWLYDAPPADAKVGGRAMQSSGAVNLLSSYRPVGVTAIEEADEA